MAQRRFPLRTLALSGVPLLLVLSCFGDAPQSSSPPAGDDGGGPVLREDAGAETGAADATPRMTGNRRWHRVLAPVGATVDVAGGSIDTEGSVLVTGSAEAKEGSATIDFGDGKQLVIDAANRREAFIARYGPSGTCEWAQLVSGAGSEVLSRVAFTPEGEAVAVGSTQGVLDASVRVDNVPVTKPTNGGARDILVVKLERTGRRLWHRIYGAKESDDSEALAVGRDGSIIIGGNLSRSETSEAVEFPPKSVDLPSSPARVAFVTLLDDDGLAKWTHGYPTSGTVGASNLSRVRALTVDGAGDIVLAGTFDHSIDFRYEQSGSPLVLQHRGSGRDGFIAKLAAADGQTRWASQLGGDFDDSADDIAVDPEGAIYVAGSYTGPGPVLIGTHTMPIYGDVEGFVTKLDPSGQSHAWARGFGSAVFESAQSVAVDPWGNVVVGGTQSATLTWGTDRTSSIGGRDAFVVKLAPPADRGRWARSIGSAADDPSSSKVAVAKGSGVTLVTGGLNGAAQFDGEWVGLPDGGIAPYGFILVVDP